MKAVENIQQQTVMSELDNDITKTELHKALTKLTDDKAPGINGVPPNGFKIINEENVCFSSSS